MEHELPFRVPATFVVELIIFHSDLATHLVFLTSGTEGRLPLMRSVRRYYDILIITARHSRTIGHLHSCLPPLRCGLPLLAVTLLLGLLSKLRLGILLSVVLILHPLFVAQA